MKRAKATPERKHIVYIGLGSNLGDRQIFIAYGIKRLSRMEKTVIRKLSGLYATEPVDVPDRTPFLNMVIQVDTKIDVYSFLNNLQHIEKDAGRIKIKRNKSRVLDMDILFYDNDIIKKRNLIVPHPEVHKRRFMLQPLADIASDLVHPVKKKTIQELLVTCPEKHWVNRLQ